MGNVNYLLASSLALSACSSSDSRDSVSNVNSEEIQPYSASRFLGQAAFGGDEFLISSVINNGYERWLNEQISMALTTSHVDWLISKGKNKLGINGVNLAGNGNWQDSVWKKLFTSPDIFRQRIVLVWSELFVVSALGLTVNWKNFAMASYVDNLERLAFANFREILNTVTLSSAMGTYLSMKGSKKYNPITGSVPDENYAREIMQLFTIGLYQMNSDGTYILDTSGKPLETYNNSDIQGLAAVFTGWDANRLTDPTGNLDDIAYNHTIPMKLDEANHSSDEKRFLEVYIPAGTSGEESLKIALDYLFNHPNVAPFIAKHFIQRLVTSNPTPNYVKRVANVFMNNGAGVRGDMSAVIKSILLDNEARDETDSMTYGKLREPIIRMLQWGRLFNAYSVDETWDLYFTDPDTKLAQSPFYAQSVFNFFTPDFTPPNTKIAHLKLVAPEFQLVTEPSVVGYINFMQEMISNSNWNIRARYHNYYELASQYPEALVDKLALYFCANKLDAYTINRIKSAVLSIIVEGDEGLEKSILKRIYVAILLIMSSAGYLIQK